MVVTKPNYKQDVSEVISAGQNVLQSRQHLNFTRLASFSQIQFQPSELNRGSFVLSVAEVLKFAQIICYGCRNFPSIIILSSSFLYH